MQKEFGHQLNKLYCVLFIFYFLYVATALCLSRIKLFHIMLSRGHESFAANVWWKTNVGISSTTSDMYRYWSTISYEGSNCHPTVRFITLLTTVIGNGDDCCTHLACIVVVVVYQGAAARKKRLKRASSSTTTNCKNDLLMRLKCSEVGHKQPNKEPKWTDDAKTV